MDAGFQQHAGMEMTEVVEPHMPLARMSCQLLEVASKGSGVNWLARWTWKQQTVVLVYRSHLCHSEDLFPAMVSQQLNGVLIEATDRRFSADLGYT
jgi:hypothetical protein